MSSGSRASQPWLQSRYAPKMVKGDLSLLQKEKTSKDCLQPGLGVEGGKGWKCSWMAATWLGLAVRGKVPPGRGEKAHSQHLGSSPPSATLPKPQPAKADVLTMGVLHHWGFPQ